MALRKKRRVKQRSKAHQAYVKTKRKRRLKRGSKVGYGTAKRRAKKAKRTKKGKR